MARHFLRGNPQDRVPPPYRRSCRPPVGAVTSGSRVAVVETQASRRLTNPVGGDAACQQEVVAHTNIPGPAQKRVIYPTAMAPPNQEEPFEAGECLPARSDGEITTATHPHLALLPFKEIWAVDFEFGSEPGENPGPVCLVAWELKSGRMIRHWRD